MSVDQKTDDTIELDPVTRISPNCEIFIDQKETNLQQSLGEQRNVWAGITLNLMKTNRGPARGNSQWEPSLSLKFRREALQTVVNDFQRDPDLSMNRTI